MTDNKLATSGPAMTVWHTMRDQAKTLLDSGFLPKTIRTPEQALAIMQAGIEIGLQPMQALRSIHVIDGKPVMSADLIAGLAMSRHPGGTLRVVETTSDRCAIEAGRAGQALTMFEFTISDATKAGLTGKDVWRKYPRAMLRARCITEAARAIFPDVVAGIFDPDELGGSPDVAQLAGSYPELRQLPERVTPDVSPHGVYEDLSEPERAALVDAGEMMDMLIAAERLLEAGSWSAARDIIGAKGAPPTEFGRLYSAAKLAGTMAPSDSKELGKLWGNINRRIEKEEKKDLEKPVDCVDSLSDGPEEFDRSL